LALLRVCVGVFQQVLHAPSVLLTISASRCLVSILLGGAYKTPISTLQICYYQLECSTKSNNSSPTTFGRPSWFFGGLFFILFYFLETCWMLKSTVSQLYRPPFFLFLVFFSFWDRSCLIPEPSPREEK
jgi:hypothetical protein